MGNFVPLTVSNNPIGTFKTLQLIAIISYENISVLLVANSGPGQTKNDVTEADT